MLVKKILTKHIISECNAFGLLILFAITILWIPPVTLTHEGTAKVEITHGLTEEIVFQHDIETMNTEGWELFPSTSGIYPDEGLMNLHNISKAQEFSQGSGVAYAIIDTGLSYHKDFEGKSIKKLVRFNDDGDLIFQTENPVLMEETNGHGTAMAGVIFAIAPLVDLYVIDLT